MASPTSSSPPSEHSQKSRKRNVKPVIPALPLFPSSKKSAKTETVAGTKAEPDHVPAPTTSEAANSEPLAVQDEQLPSSTDVSQLLGGQAKVVTPGEFEDEKVEITAVVDHESVEGGLKLITNKEDEVATGRDDGQEQLGTSSEVQPRLDEHEVTDKHENALPKNNEVSATRNSTVPSAPLIIDSTAVIRHDENLRPSGFSETQEYGHIRFQAPPESRDASPIHMNGNTAIPEAQSFYMTSAPVPQSIPQAVPDATNQWVSHQGQHSQSSMPPMQPYPIVTSSFSPDAPVFTPANETPPYSLTSTPAIGSTGNTPGREYSSRNSLHKSHLPVMAVNNYNGYHPHNPMHARHMSSRSQHMSHALNEQRNPSAQHAAIEANGVQRSRAASLENEGLKMPLVEHLTALYDAGVWADWRIILQHPKKAFNPVGLAVHGAVISRNATLELYMQHTDRASNKQSRDLHIEWADSFIHPSSFNSAVRYLYNEVLLTKEDVERMTYPGDFGPSWRQYQLHSAMSYFLSGYVLKLLPVINRGQELVSSFMNWDIVEMALHWAIDYRPKAPLEEGAAMTRETSTMSSYSVATSSSESRGNTSTFEPVPLNTLPNGTPLVISSAASDLLLEVVMNFLSTNIPFESFVLDSDVRPMEMRARLPMTKEFVNSQRPGPNAHLSSIHFGDFSNGNNDGRASRPPFDAYQNHVASIALTNLPFDHLNGLLSLLQQRGDPRAHEFAKQIVADRESLRNQVLRSKSVPLQERQTNLKEWEAAGYEERIVELGQDEVNGQSYAPFGRQWKLERVWTGLENPSAKGHNSKRKFRRDQAMASPFEHQAAVQFQNGPFFHNQHVPDTNANA